MTALAQSTKSYFVLEPWNVKGVVIVLILIPSVLAHKTVKCGIEAILTGLINKEKLFQVVNKHILSYIGNSSYIATHIFTNSRNVYLPSCVSHHLLSPSSVLSPNGSIVVALNPEVEVSFCNNHGIIDLLILIEFFQICNISSDVTQTNAAYQIDQIWDSYDQASLIPNQKLVESNCPNHNPSYEEDSAYDDCCVHGGVLLNRHICLGDIGVIHIEEHVTEPRSYDTINLGIYDAIWRGWVNLVRHLLIIHLLLLIVKVVDTLLIGRVHHGRLIGCLIILHGNFIRCSLILQLTPFILFIYLLNIYDNDSLALNEQAQVHPIKQKRQFIQIKPNHVNICHINNLTKQQIIDCYLRLVNFKYQNQLIIKGTCMYKQQSGNKLDNWLAYSPLIYSHLMITPVTSLTSINSVKWLRGFVNVKSSFKFHEGFVLVTGPISKNSKSNNKEGGLAIYKCNIPAGEQLDDNRLKPLIKLRSNWLFQQETSIMQQYGNNLQDSDQNNMFAIAYKTMPIVNLISTKKMLDEGNHNAYIDSNSIKLEGHKSPLTDIKWANFQSGGHKIFTSSYDSNIIQWDIEKISLQRQLKYHKMSVEAITPLFNQGSAWGQGPVINNAANTLASASTDGNLFIWDNRTSTPVSKINANQKQLYCVDCVSENSLLSGGSTGSIKLWDLRNLRQYAYESKLDKLYGHTGKIRQLKVKRFYNERYKSNKNSLAGRVKFTTSGDDGKVIQWQQKYHFSHQGHEGPSTFDLSQDNQLSVSADVRKNIFMVWQSGVSMGQNQS